jgi:hypothetical protein
VIASLPRTIPREEVRRLLGYPPGRALPARVEARLDALLPEARALLRPRGACETVPLREAVAVALATPGPPGSFSGFVLGLVSIGPGVETRAADAMRAEQASDALLLDAIGSAAAEAAADAMGSLIAKTTDGTDAEIHAGAVAGPKAGVATEPGPPATPCRISPGYAAWPLTAQKAIFARLPHEAIGVRLLPSMLMIPRKSVTFALWLDSDGRVAGGQGGCSRCALDPCPRRIDHQPRP